METKFTSNAPVSAFAAAGVCTALPGASVSPAVVRLLTAPVPQVHQVQIADLTILAPRSYQAPENKPSMKLGGSRGVPPRGRPV